MEKPVFTPPKINRIESIDLLRGTVMVIMALDHIRDFFHGAAFYFHPTDLSRTSPAIFLTRWITHFCAPVFVFLAGTSAFLSGTKKTKKELSFFLFTRGIWLILVEVFIVSFGFTFNPGFPFILLQVIWAIGVCMISLSLLIHLPLRWIMGIGILLIAGHNALDGIQVPGEGFASVIWSLLHQPGFFSTDHFNLVVGYPVIPWIGVISLGYCLGNIYLPSFDPQKRKKILSWTGWGAVALFILLRTINIYGDPSPWSTQKNIVFTLLSFLNTTKYPPSLLYLLMTLGPAMIFLSVTEKPMGFFSRKITLFGRVPMFYYIVHLYWLHLLAMLAVVLTGHKWSEMVLNGFIGESSQLRGFGFNLFTVYLIWIAIVLSLYPLCKWYDRYKKNHRSTWWLSYL
jgi:uncharacterized membrane protein